MDGWINEFMPVCARELTEGILPWNPDKLVGDLQKVSLLDPFK